MTQSLTLYSGAPARPYFRTPDGEILWTWIALAFVAYWAFFAWGSLTGATDSYSTALSWPNTVGGLVVLAVLAWAVLERLWVKVDAVVLGSLAAMLIPLGHLATGDAMQTGQAVFKYESVFAVIAMSRLLRLPVAFRSKRRWALAVPVLIILLICLLVDRGFEGGAGRHSGLFKNPNNLALIPFLLLFLIDEERDPLPLRFSVHAVVAGVLLYSGTSGALIAYAIGMAIHLKDRLSPAVRMTALTVMLTGGAATAILIVNGDGILPETRLTKQLFLMRSQIQDVLSGETLRYYEEERLLGEGSASGIWRVAQWRRSLAAYGGFDAPGQLFGAGTGASWTVLGNLPHNEYVRILLEQGIVGLFLFLFVWRRLLISAPKPVRYVGLIIAIYSFSENNMDNFPFMTLFVLFLSATGGAAENPIRGGARRVRLPGGRPAPAFGMVQPGKTPCES